MIYDLIFSLEDVIYLISLSKKKSEHFTNNFMKGTWFIFVTI